MRNATGTDPALDFSISPWPAVPVFGIEVGALFVAAALVGIALGLAGIAGWRGHSGTRAGLWLAGGALFGLGAPVADPDDGSGFQGDDVTLSYLLRSPIGSPATRVTAKIDGRQVISVIYHKDREDINTGRITVRETGFNNRFDRRK